jgi:hypothetical protein
MARRLARQRRTGLDLSATSIKSEDDLAAIDDHRDGASAFGILKHLPHSRGILGDVDVLEGDLPLAVVLTGGRGIGSGVLAKDQHFLSHPRTLLCRVPQPQSTTDRAPLVIRVKRPS